MRFYETTIVLSPQADDATIEKEIDKVTKTITSTQGKLVTTQKWGVKRMAYPVMDHTQAYYVHFVYQSEPSVPGSLESMFRINENILRHLTILVEGPLTSKRLTEAHAATAKPAYAGGTAAPVAVAADTPAASSDAPAVVETVAVPAVVETAAAPAEVAEPAEKVDAGESKKGSE